MFGLFKKKVKEPETFQNHDQEYEFTWHEVGKDNPFNKQILDIRSFTQHMLSFTKEKYVAELFNKQRHSIGRELINTKIPKSKTINVSLVYPHNGSKIEGAAYKANCMEDKWDIYGWDNIIYLTRSWTGEVVYKAFIKVTDASFEIQKIEYTPDVYSENDQSLVVNDVHFLIKTLALGAIYPHKVPTVLTNEKDIAIYSFNRFGHNCWYATYYDILDVAVKIS
ncbi:hypothetical protein [Pedobacter caeni]|uniref:Uncharacterized protein n=1 Tax=Pedobacter caeni TaxID=288992 RepID=A0A1M4TQD3_9SPHI|nr:hypothetical protein [Pedobacter caeni]SHE46638.1 hypothetical protein SAMN04488522_101278 [Pedobacter caeni]